MTSKERVMAALDHQRPDRIPRFDSYWDEFSEKCIHELSLPSESDLAAHFGKRYGRDLLIIGGVSKRILAGPTEAITREVERLAPLVEEGGYIPTPDHRVPPDVPLANYIHYLKEAKRVWGKNLPNLQPTGRTDPNAPKVDAERYSWHLGN